MHNEEVRRLKELSGINEDDARQTQKIGGGRPWSYDGTGNKTYRLPDGTSTSNEFPQALSHKNPLSKPFNKLRKNVKNYVHNKTKNIVDIASLGSRSSIFPDMNEDEEVRRLKELSGIKEADRSDVTHAQLVPHIKNVKAAMIRHAQEDPSEANEFIEHLDDMMTVGDVEVVDMMQPDWMDTEARDSLISYFEVSISQDPALYNMIFPGEDIKWAQGEYKDMFESPENSVKEDDRTEKAMKDMQPTVVTGYYEITDFFKEHTQMWDKSVDEVMHMIYEWTWIEMTTATRDRDELAKRTLAIVVDALRNKKDDMTFDDMIAQLESKTEEVRRLKELSGIKEDASSPVFQIMKKSLLRSKWYLENEEMDPEMVSSELRDINNMLDAVEDGIDDISLVGLDTSVDEQYMHLHRQCAAKLKGAVSNIYGVDHDVLPLDAKPNPDSPYNSGQVEESSIAEAPVEEEQINEIDPSRSPWTQNGKHPGAMDADELRDELAVFDELRDRGDYLSPKEIAQEDSLWHYLEKIDGPQVKENFVDDMPL